MSRKQKFPPLIKLTLADAHSVATMFKYYDLKQSGKIKNHLAKNLVRSLGFNTDSVILSSEVSLNEVLLLLDQMTPDPDPPLPSSMITFTGLAAKRSDDGLVLTPQDISDFMEQLGRPPASISEASLLLNSMLEYDDCAEIPILQADHFAKEVINYSKKYNSLKDFR